MERERVTEPESTPQPAAHEAVATAPHAALLSLQRSAGNRAVTRLLARTPQEDTLKAMQGTKGYGALTEAERKRLDSPTPTTRSGRPTRTTTPAAASSSPT